MGTIIGHEFVGTVVATGDNITKFSIGDDVISNFSIECGECWYCKHGYSGQCNVTNTFGKVGLDGGQAEYVRVPYAETTLTKNHQPQIPMTMLMIQFMCLWQIFSLLVIMG